MVGRRRDGELVCILDSGSGSGKTALVRDESLLLLLNRGTIGICDIFHHNTMYAQICGRKSVLMEFVNVKSIFPKWPWASAGTVGKQLKVRTEEATNLRKARSKIPAKKVVLDDDVLNDLI